MSEALEQSGVIETTVAAEQETATEVKTESSTETQPTETKVDEGVKQEQPAAETEKVEKAFAARLAKERQKIETEAKQRARDEWIAEQGYEWNGKPITTEAEYKQAIYERELQEKGIDPTEVKKQVDEHPDVKAARELKQKLEKEARDRQEALEFIEEFPGVKFEDVPAEVWAENAKGKSLVDAYARYALKQARAAEAKAKANETTAKASMGSVNSSGETAEGFISRETFEAKRNDRQWIIKNLSKIQTSRAKW